MAGLYAGFLPILCKYVALHSQTVQSSDTIPRQIPYAIGQFTVNEFCHELAFRSMSEETKRSLSGTANFGISLGSGIIAGFAAAILSQVSVLLYLLHRSCS